MVKKLSPKSIDIMPMIDAKLANDIDHAALKSRHGAICAEIVKLREKRDEAAVEINVAASYPDEASAIAAGALPISGKPVAAQRESTSSLNNRLNVLEQAATKLATEMSVRKQDLVRQMYSDTFRDEQLAVAEEMVEALLFFGEQSGIESARLHDLQRAGITMLSYPRVGIPRLASSAAINEYLVNIRAVGYVATPEQLQRIDGLRKREIETAR